MPKYNKKMVDRITSLIRADTYTQREICEIVGLDETTFGRWKMKYPEFDEAIEAAKDECMAKMVVEAKNSLRKKIIGYTVPEKKTTYTANGISEDGKIQKGKVKEMIIIEKHYQPDTAAIIFMLTNGDPAHWKNRINNEVTGKDGKDLFEKMTDEEIEKKIEELEQKK